MLKQALSFLGSISVAILITAAGLLFDARELTYAGGGLLALVASGWLLLRFNPSPDPKHLEAVQKIRRTRIREARQEISGFKPKNGTQSFRDVFESTTIYSTLERHFRPEFRAAWNNRRLALHSNGGPLDPFAKLLLEEINYLEQKWGLENS